jgi:hypothetical protein
VLDLRLDRGDGMPRVALIPGPIEVLGGHPELDDEVCREVLRPDLASLFLPQPDQGLLVLAHDNAGIRAAYEAASIGQSRHHGAAGRIRDITICSLSHSCFL